MKTIDLEILERLAKTLNRFTPSSRLSISRKDISQLYTLFQEGHITYGKDPITQTYGWKITQTANCLGKRTELQ